MQKSVSGRRFSPGARLSSFRYAFSGLTILFRDEHNAIIHFIILVFVIIAGIFFGVSKGDWIAISLSGAIVFASECFNTAIENLSDIISGEKDIRIKKVKDLAAAGVLVSALVAAIVGLIIFVPEILELFEM